MQHLKALRTLFKKVSVDDEDIVIAKARAESTPSKYGMLAWISDTTRTRRAGSISGLRICAGRSYTRITRTPKLSLHQQKLPRCARLRRELTEAAALIKLQRTFIIRGHQKAQGIALHIRIIAQRAREQLDAEAPAAVILAQVQQAYPAILRMRAAAGVRCR